MRTPAEYLPPAWLSGKLVCIYIRQSANKIGLQCKLRKICQSRISFLDEGINAYEKIQIWSNLKQHQTFHDGIFDICEEGEVESHRIWFAKTCVSSLAW